MKTRTLVSVLAVLAVMTAGCVGPNEPAPAATQGDTPDAQPATKPDIGIDSPIDSSPREVAHALGNTLIEGIPTRIVALEWPYVEALLALGVEPVGVADVEGYSSLVATTPALGSDVTDVGTRQEPNLEAIAALEPDLIVGVKFRHEKIHVALSDLAPTLTFDSFPADGTQYESMEAAVRALALALGNPALADDVLGDLQAAFDEAAARLDAAGTSDRPFVLAQVLAGDAAQIRLFQSHQVAVRMLTAMGIENAWDDEFAANGFSTVGIEALRNVEHADFLFVLSSGASLDAFAENPAWRDLAFVREGRLYDLSGAWLLAGPLSGKEFVTRAADALAPPATGPREVAHALGTLTIEGTPQRVVALEWTYVEDLLALGVQPVGVADVAGYRKWVNVDAVLAEDVADVGTRQEPNLEAIAALEPDLIVGVKFRHEKVVDTLTDIAPTLLFDPYPPQDAGLSQYAEMEQTFRAIGKALNREARAVAVLNAMDAHLAGAADGLAAAGAAGAEVVVAQAFTFNDAPVIRVFTQDAMASEIVERLGLVNAWDDGYQTYGFTTASVEALEPVQHASFLYVVQDDDNVFANQLASHPVWANLTFVKEDRAEPLGGDTWLFGGPLSARVVADRILAAMTAA